MAFPDLYAYIFNADEEVLGLVRTYAPLFLVGTIMFPIQMTLQNLNVAFGQAKSAIVLAVMRKVGILIPLCFVLSHFLSYPGVYMSEGIADLVAGTITGIVIFSTFPRIIRRRSESAKKYVGNDS